MVSVMEEIYSRLTKGVRKPKHKVALFLCGASGTGKTTSRQTILDDIGLKTTYVYVNIDEIRPIVGLQETARPIVTQVVHKARDDGYSVVWDATCRNTKDILSEMSAFQEKGYRVVLAMVYADLKTAISRVKKRTTQDTTPEVAREIYTEFSRKAERYMNVGELYLYNNEHTAKLLLSKKDARIQCHHPEMKFYFDLKPYCS